MRARTTLVLCLALTAGCTQTPPPSAEDLPGVGEAEEGEVSVLAEDLDTPWELAFSPDGRVFVTERPGTIKVIGEGGEPRVWREMPDTVEQGESGLMGLALHPEFPEQAWVYACQTHRDGDGELRNRVVRIRDTDEGAGEPQAIVEGIDAGSVHDGCRLAFGPAEGLFVAMGDGADASRAQDERDRNGKVLRYTPEGEPAGAGEEGWHPAVFTIGHRNPQGIDFHPETGTPYISEHGPENHDEVNVLRVGANYGWPAVRGMDDGGGGYAPSIWTSGAESTVAPAGAAFVDAPDSELHGALAVATLKEAQLHVFEIAGEAADEPEVTGEHVLFEGDFGRLRAAQWGPDDALHVTTSNHDGRGTPGAHDDRILRVPLATLEEAVS